MVNRYVVDGRRYALIAHRATALALALRAMSLPPSWALIEPATSAVEARARRPVRAVYLALRYAGAACSLLDACGGSLRVGSIASVAAADRVSATAIKGFAPYTDHLYFYGLILIATGHGRGDGSAGDVPPAAAYLPAVVYCATGVTKLRNGARSWLVTGDIIDNAVDLYRWNHLGDCVTHLNPAWLARAVLAYELLALPLSLLNPRCLQIVSLIGLAFHIGNFAALRISFWHLAVMHIAGIGAVRRSDRHRLGRRR